MKQSWMESTVKAAWRFLGRFQALQLLQFQSARARVCERDAESTGKRVTIVTHFWPRRPGKVGVLTETVVRKLYELDQEVVQVGVQKRCSPESPPSGDVQWQNEALLEAKLAGAGGS